MNDFHKFLDENLKKVQLESNAAMDSNVETYDVYGEIREAIISLRRENHLTQKQLAAKAGITQANLCNLENGISKPTIDSLKKIADATETRLVVDFMRQEI